MTDKYGLYARWWKDGRLHEQTIAYPLELEEWARVMRYGSELGDRISSGPIDVSQIDSLELVLLRME